MLRDYEAEIKNRVKFIREILNSAKADGIVYGNSGGKDSTLTGILCRMACDNTVGIIMPCCSNRNLHEDTEDGMKVAEQFNIKTVNICLSEAKSKLLELYKDAFQISPVADANISPRLRMITLYSYAASHNMLVAGTGNRSESYMGYFTKWGDGAYDFNPIIDLTVTEIYEFLAYLNAPESIIKKAPSAGLYDGQTDETEMGITYKKIDDYLLNGKISPDDKKIIAAYHNKNHHKREMPVNYTAEKK